MTSREERQAKNEALFRSINQNVKGIAARGAVDPGGGLEFLCECWRLDCDELLTLSEDQYRTVRSDPSWFFVVPGHESLDIERVVDDKGDYRVVEKIGRGRDIVVEMAEPS